jgi:uncharacterized protein with LGFP repeats
MKLKTSIKTSQLQQVETTTNPTKLGKILVGLASTICLVGVPVATNLLLLNQPVAAVSNQRAIYGHIFDKWVSMGGERSPLGNPTTDELPAANGGRYNDFQHGAIYWHPNIGAYAVYGLIGQKWISSGRERGFGYPITDELPAANGGRYNDFQNNASIYWHPNTGAHVVYGDIRAKWVQMGREKSRLGYPISDEEAVGSAGQRISRFQRGAIYWNSGTRRTRVVYH